MSWKNLKIIAKIVYYVLNTGKTLEWQIVHNFIALCSEEV